MLLLIYINRIICFLVHYLTRMVWSGFFKHGIQMRREEKVFAQILAAHRSTRHMVPKWQDIDILWFHRWPLLKIMSLCHAWNVFFSYWTVSCYMGKIKTQIPRELEVQYWTIWAPSRRSHRFRNWSTWQQCLIHASTLSTWLKKRSWLSKLEYSGKCNPFLSCHVTFLPLQHHLDLLDKPEVALRGRRIILEAFS